MNFSLTEKMIQCHLIMVECLLRLRAMFPYLTAKFMHNIAYSAGVMNVYDSYCYGSVRLAQSIFSHNKAMYGGVGLIIMSLINIDNCAFIDNHAVRSGGVIYIYNQSSLNITSAADEGGVIRLYTLKQYRWLLIITKVGTCGARNTVHSVNSTYSISRNIFENNSAIKGGVLYTRSFAESSVIIADNDFTYNHADFALVESCTHSVL